MSAKLMVVVTSTRRYIDVPSSRASALHTFLRSHGIGSAPPEPCFTGVDSIELIKGTDVRAVQALLDEFA